MLDTRDAQPPLRIATQQTIQPSLTDVVMPLMKETELARRFQAGSPATRVLLMSAYTLSEVAASGYALIAKPFTVDALAEPVRHVRNQPSPCAQQRPQGGPSDG